jgi:hypothetical protein
MTNILSTVESQTSRFIPSKPKEFLALQLAKRLSDTDSLRSYLVLFEHHPEDLLLQVYRRCHSEEKLTGESFLQTLREITTQPI